MDAERKMSALEPPNRGDGEELRKDHAGARSEPQLQFPEQWRDGSDRQPPTATSARGPTRWQRADTPATDKLPRSGSKSETGSNELIAGSSLHIKYSLSRGDVHLLILRISHLNLPGGGWQMSKWIRQMCGFTYLTLQRTSDCRERGASPLAKDDADTGLVQHGEFLGAFVLGKAIHAMELRAVPDRGDLIVAGGNLCGGS